MHRNRLPDNIIDLLNHKTTQKMYYIFIYFDKNEEKTITLAGRRLFTELCLDTIDYY